MRCNLWILAALLTSLTTAIVAAEPTKRETNGTELIVQAVLTEMDAPAGEVHYEPNQNLAAAFPGYLFALAQFESVAPEDLPSPLKPLNLFVVPPDGIAKLLATPEDVIELFKSAFKPIKTADDAKKAAEAALALEQARYPEQPFATMPDDLKVTPDGLGGFQVSGSSDPTAPSGSPNGSGSISVSLSIGATGIPSNITIVNNYKAPPRRNRQITPADIAADQPIVEKIIGGPVTNINSPTINKIFPGHTFFTPTKPANNNKPNPVVVVDPQGKAHVLANARMAFTMFVKASKVTTAQQIIDAEKAFVPVLAQIYYPTYKFDPLQDSDFTVTTGPQGGPHVQLRMHVTGEKKKLIRTAWATGPKGLLTGWGFWSPGI